MVASTGRTSYDGPLKPALHARKLSGSALHARGGKDSNVVCSQVNHAQPPAQLPGEPPPPLGCHCRSCAVFTQAHTPSPRTPHRPLLVQALLQPPLLQQRLDFLTSRHFPGFSSPSGNLNFLPDQCGHITLSSVGGVADVDGEIRGGTASYAHPVHTPSTANALIQCFTTPINTLTLSPLGQSQTNFVFSRTRNSRPSFFLSAITPPVHPLTGDGGDSCGPVDIVRPSTFCKCCGMLCIVLAAHTQNRFLDGCWSQDNNAFIRVMITLCPTSQQLTPQGT